MNEKTLLRTLLGCILALSLSSPVLAAKKMALDGKTFQVVSVDPQKKSGPDVLIFAKGTFHSTGCDQYGFKKAAYKLKKVKGGWSFTAVSKSAKEGVNRWAGMVKSDMTISGTLDWSKKGQKPIHYTFTGSLKK
ncbi:MAG: hypothetical protein KC609_07385 [Myxococcales bacterium]|nr:hypothetical protein [Myxococcales bacterium]